MSKYKDPDESSDSDESEEKTETMFVASAHLDLRKQNYIDLYSVSATSSNEKNQNGEDVIIAEEEVGVESECKVEVPNKSEFVDSKVNKEEPNNRRSSGETSPSKRFKLVIPNIGFSWKKKSQKKEPGDDKENEDIIVPKEELGVESNFVEEDLDVKSPDESTYQKTDKNWKFGLPRFSLGRKGTSTQGENADDGDNKDVQEVLETLPADIDVGEDDREKKKYVVKVKTSDNFTAGTSSDVYVYLYGENGDSSKFG